MKSLKATEYKLSIVTLNYGRRNSMKKKLNYWTQLFEDGTDDTKGADTKNTDTKSTDDSKDSKAGGDSKDDSKGDDKKGEPEKKYTDEDVNRIVQERLKREREKNDEAKKLEGMSAQERAEHERDALKKELDELKKADALNKMAQEARKMLSNEKINVSDGLVNMMVTSEAKTTKENVDNFIKMFKAAVQDAVKDSLRGKAPTTGGSSTLTRAELDKKLAEIASPAERQRLIAQHIDLFTKGK